jgi:hypothetical protein
MATQILRAYLDPVYNPSDISPTQVPEGWRMLRESDFAGNGLKRALVLKYWNHALKRWVDPTETGLLRNWIVCGNTYITPVEAPPVEEPAPTPEDPEFNPEEVPTSAIPEGWRLLRESDFAATPSSNSSRDPKRPLQMKFWHIGLRAWDEPCSGPRDWVVASNTYITPVEAPVEKPAPKVLNPEDVPAIKVPKGWRFLTEADVAPIEGESNWAARTTVVSCLWNNGFALSNLRATRVRPMYIKQYTYIVKE